MTLLDLRTAGGGLDETAADLIYLRLDTANKPLTGVLTWDADDTYDLAEAATALKAVYAREMSFGNKATLQAPSVFQPNWIDIQHSAATKVVDGLRIIAENTEGGVTSTSRALYLKIIANSAVDGTVLTMERDATSSTGASFPAALALGDVYSSNQITASIGGSFTLESTGGVRAVDLYAMVLGAKGATGTNYALCVPDGDIVLDSDSGRIVFGEDQDASIGHDGTDLNIRPMLVGSGRVNIFGDMKFNDNKKIVLGTGNDSTLYFSATDTILTPATNALFRVTGKMYVNTGNLTVVSSTDFSQVQVIANSVTESSSELRGFNCEVLTGASAGRGRNFSKYYGARVQASFTRAGAIAWGSNQPVFVGGDFRANYTGTGVLSGTGHPIFIGGEFLVNVSGNKAATLAELKGGSFRVVTGAGLTSLTVIDAIAGHFRTDLSAVNAATRAYGILVNELDVGSSGAILWGINVDGGDMQVSSDNYLIFEGSATVKGDTRIRYDSGNTRMQIEVNGTDVLLLDGTPGIGFYGTAPGAKQTVSGSRGANAALASLLTALATIGLLTDSSSA